MKNIFDKLFIAEFVSLTVFAPFYYYGISNVAFLTSFVILLTYIIGGSWIIVEFGENLNKHIPHRFYSICKNVKSFSVIIWGVILAITVRTFNKNTHNNIITLILFASAFIGVVLSIARIFENKTRYPK